MDIFKLNGDVYAFDSTTIDLCLSVFWWAKFRRTKGGIKVHTLYDVETQIPTYFHITPAIAHDSQIMDLIPYKSGAYYIFDRAYNKFASLYNIHQIGAYFVIRAKKNVQYKIVKWQRHLEQYILADRIIEFTEYKAKKSYSSQLRMVRFWDTEREKEMLFLTNAMDITALQVAQLYKNRWQVELFF